MGMKRLIMLAIAGIMAVMLVGCGEQAAKPEVKSDAVMESQDQKPAEESNDAATAPAPEAAPADAAPADAAPATE